VHGTANECDGRKSNRARTAAFDRIVPRGQASRRQWVLTFPFSWRPRLAQDGESLGRLKLATDSGCIWPLIPADASHHFGSNLPLRIPGHARGFGGGQFGFDLGPGALDDRVFRSDDLQAASGQRRRADDRSVLHSHLQGH